MIVSQGKKEQIKSAMIVKDALPVQFPTHLHSQEFWEHLGRCVATFGYLEEILRKAIFALTATRQYPCEEIDTAYQEWLRTLQIALTGQLYNLVDLYGKAIRNNPDSKTENINELLEWLRKASDIRNVLCHGSWRKPDSEGSSIALFVGKTKGVFTTPIDVAFLKQTQSHVAELICEVMNSVTVIGLQFPGSKGPGRQLYP